MMGTLADVMATTFFTPAMRFTFSLKKLRLIRDKGYTLHSHLNSSMTSMGSRPDTSATSLKVRLMSRSEWRKANPLLELPKRVSSDLGQNFLIYPDRSLSIRSLSLRKNFRFNQVPTQLMRYFLSKLNADLSSWCCGSQSLATSSHTWLSILR